MNKVTQIEIVADYTLRLHFKDGTIKVIDFEPLLGKEISAKLLDKDFFKQVTIDNGGGVEWPNGFDCCPNFLKEYHSKQEYAQS